MFGRYILILGWDNHKLHLVLGKDSCQHWVKDKSRVSLDLGKNNLSLVSDTHNRVKDKSSLTLASDIHIVGFLEEFDKKLKVFDKMNPG